MKDTLQTQNWISNMCRATTKAALAFAAVLALAVITISTQSAQAQTYTVLHSFDGTDGAEPNGGLVQGTDGRLYGTTGADTYGGGTVFEITPGGTLTTLYRFCLQSGCTDGAAPDAGLVQGTDGDFYGTTNLGGAYGYGTVFKITPSGTLTTLHSFCSQQTYTCGDGAYPGPGALVQADGNFYGTTLYRGAHGYGTVFEITPGGTLTTLYTFCSQAGCADGGNSEGGLIHSANGDFYGTTYTGGTHGSGTVFEMTPSGALTTLYSFCSQSSLGIPCADGANPAGGLVPSGDMAFYGTTYEGGTYSEGTVFKINTCGDKLTTLDSFDLTDGAAPFAGLVHGSDGNFYGTTFRGGTGGTGDGTVFKITPGGTLTTLHDFCSQSDCTDGSFPWGGPLAQDTNGNFYGTTSAGGTNSDGTVFELSVGLGPFVQLPTTSGKVEADVMILGTKLTGATSVAFNGTGAVFKVVSSSLITATVPAGATTGKVEVVTPSRTLSSNVNFRVTP